MRQENLAVNSIDRSCIPGHAIDRSLKELRDAEPEDAVTAHEEEADEFILYDRYHRPLLAVLRRMTRDQMLAEDLAHDALIIAIQRLRKGNLDTPEKLGPFLFQTARYLYIAECRRRQSRKTDCFSDLETLQMGEPAVEPAEELHQVLWEALAKLSQVRDRDILIRSYICDEPKGVTCEALALTPSQYDRVISRARNRLRDCSIFAANCSADAAESIGL